MIYIKINFLSFHHTELNGHVSILRLHTAIFCIAFIGFPDLLKAISGFV